MSQRYSNPDAWAAAIMDAITEYGDGVTDAVKDATDEAAKVCLQEVRASSPKRTGAYRKGWKKATTKENATAKTVTVYNKDHYRLTHLLENGHAKVGGGRVEGHPHIGPAEQRAAELLERQIRVKVAGGA